MKHWRINYAVEYIDGHREEKDATVEGRNITIAMGTALCDVIDPLKKQPEVSRAAIRKIEIVEDAFPED